MDPNTPKPTPDDLLNTLIAHCNKHDYVMRAWYDKDTHHTRVTMTNKTSKIRGPLRYTLNDALEGLHETIKQLNLVTKFNEKHNNKENNKND